LRPPDDGFYPDRAARARKKRAGKKRAGLKRFVGEGDENHRTLKEEFPQK
jgi:hypothetical protein